MTLKVLLNKLSGKHGLDARSFINHFVTFTVLLFVLRGIHPHFKYLFAGLILMVLLFSFFYARKLIVKNLLEMIREYYLALILCGIFLVSLFFTNTMYLVAVKEFITSIVLFFTMVILSYFNNTRSELSVFYENLLKYLIFFALIISITGILTLFDVISSNYLPSIESYFFYGDPNFNHGYQNDVNFTALIVCLGLIIVLHEFSVPGSPYKKTLYFILINIFIVYLLLSSSRRALFFVILLLLVSFMLFLSGLFLRDKLMVHLKKCATNFILIFSVLISVVLLYIYTASYDVKDRTLELIGCENKTIAKGDVAYKMYQILATFKSSFTVRDIYNTVWSIENNPNDPDRGGWGLRNHITVYPLQGVNNEIVPPDAMGYLMDKTCNASSWSGNAHSISQIGTIKLNSADTLDASVYCFVSEYFNGTSVLITLTDEQGRYARFKNYDLNSKNQWQKLSVSLTGFEGEVTFNLLFSRYSVTDFTDLTGHVIFAYPEYRLSVKNRDHLSKAGLDNTRKYNSIPFNFSSLISLPSLSYLKPPDSLKNDVSTNITPVRKGGRLDLNFQEWIARLSSKDTSFLMPKSNLFVNPEDNDMINSRTYRWSFAIRVFKQEFNLKQKILGGGFDYLSWYGYYFLNDKSQKDWPHNPILSVLLYSGIAGLLIYLLFLYKVLILYIKYIKEYPFLLIFFIITFIFSLLSGNSPFDPPIMGFFALLPFLVNYVHRKDMISIIYS